MSKRLQIYFSDGPQVIISADDDSNLSRGDRHVSIPIDLNSHPRIISALRAAMEAISLHLATEIGVPVDTPAVEDASRHLMKELIDRMNIATNQGDQESVRAWAKMTLAFQYGKGDSKDFEAAKLALKKLADDGDIKAAQILDEMDPLISSFGIKNSTQ